jgi:hypothetical protein
MPLDRSIEVCNLAQLSGDDLLLQVPLSVVMRLVNFGNIPAGSDGCDRVLAFCIEYFNLDRSRASLVFRTPYLTRLGREQLGRLCELDDLSWGFLSAAAGRAILDLHSQLDRQQQQSAELQYLLHEQRRQTAELENLLYRLQRISPL